MHGENIKKKDPDVPKILTHRLETGDTDFWRQRKESLAQRRDKSLSSGGVYVKKYSI